MSMKKRAEQMDNFRDNPDVPIFLLNKQCGSVGINLTVASHIMILETSWNPVWEDQAISRAHRLGQKGPITVLRYICKGAGLPARFFGQLSLSKHAHSGLILRCMTCKLLSVGTLLTPYRHLHCSTGGRNDRSSCCRGHSHPAQLTPSRSDEHCSYPTILVLLCTFARSGPRPCSSLAAPPPRCEFCHRVVMHPCSQSVAWAIHELLGSTHVDTVESRLRDLVKLAHDSDDGKEDQLVSAVECKDTFASDEKALNETVTKIFKEQEIALLIGDLDELGTDDESDED
jgi:hypothetical protein